MDGFEKSLQEFYAGQPARKRVVVPLSVHCLESLCKPGSDPNRWMRITSGVPTDAKMVNFTLDPFKEEMVFTFEHESFDAIPAGKSLPLVHVLVSAHNCRA